ncbi:hypothetical protein CGRA01v4_03300 [Colletotrichum graminicola]|nr:hypothetical protein CGRA01v4_03300 [Colletotrichum graminicola]
MGLQGRIVYYLGGHGCTAFIGEDRTPGKEDSRALGFQKNGWDGHDGI